MSRSLCLKVHWLEKNIPPPLLAMLTNIGYGFNLTKKWITTGNWIAHECKHAGRGSMTVSEGWLLGKLVSMGMSIGSSVGGWWGYLDDAASAVLAVVAIVIGRSELQRDGPAAHSIRWKRWPAVTRWLHSLTAHKWPQAEKMVCKSWTREMFQ